MTETVDWPTFLRVLTPEQLTGADVEHVRTAHGVGRADFARSCGYPGPSRITNIEKKDSWKEGDRERVLEGLRQLAANPPRGTKGRLKGETGAERAARLDAALKKRGTHRDDTDAPPNVIAADDAEDDGPTVVVEESSSDDVINDVSEPVAEESAVVLPFPNDGVRNLTNSEVGTWMRCHRKWWLAVYRRLTLKQSDFMGPRAIGNRVHRALAAWYAPEGKERTDPRDALERAIVEDWDAIVRQARAHPSFVDDETSLGDLSARYQTAVQLERAMIEGYVEFTIERGDDAHLRVTASETPISAVIEGEVAGEKVHFRALALLDARLTRVADGVRLFEDHKTVGNFASKRKVLHMDPQMLHYHLLEWLNTPEGEARCDGALYNMLRKVKRTPQAKPPFYDRVEVHHNDLELDAYKRRLMGVAREIMRAERELDAGADPMSVAYPNAREECSWDCDFFPICPMFDDGSRVEDAIAALYTVEDPLARYDLTRL